MKALSDGQVLFRHMVVEVEHPLGGSAKCQTAPSNYRTHTKTRFLRC
jgi:hypothetical protein